MERNIQHLATKSGSFYLSILRKKKKQAKNMSYIPYTRGLLKSSWSDKEMNNLELRNIQSIQYTQVKVQAEIVTRLIIRQSDILSQSHSQRKRRNFFTYILTYTLLATGVLNSWEEVYIYAYVATDSFLTQVSKPKARFSIATTPTCRRGRYSFQWITPFTLDLYLIMLSVKQGGIKLRL